MPTEHDAVAVYASLDEADTVVRALVDARVSRERIVCDDGAADRASLRGEMREELERSFVAPQAALAMTKDMTEGAAAMVPIGVLVGALLGLPLGFIEIGELPLWGRLLIAAAIGAFTGSLVGLIVGAGAGAKGPVDPMAAEKGVTVRVRSADGRALEILHAHHPLRLDVVTPEGIPEGYLPEDGAASVIEGGHRVADRMDQGGGDWSHVENNERTDRNGRSGRTRRARPGPAAG
jgi:hypothetical protein